MELNSLIVEDAILKPMYVSTIRPREINAYWYNPAMDTLKVYIWHQWLLSGFYNTGTGDNLYRTLQAIRRIIGHD